MKKGTQNMSAFIKSNFEYHGGYLHYNTEDGERKFVARFKHRGPVTKAKFQKALIQYYSVEEYFSRLGGAYNPKGETPLGIFMNDGLLEYREENDRGYLILDGKLI